MTMTYDANISAVAAGTGITLTAGGMSVDLNWTTCELLQRALVAVEEADDNTFPIRFDDQGSRVNVSLVYDRKSGELPDEYFPVLIRQDDVIVEFTLPYEGTSQLAEGLQRELRNMPIETSIAKTALSAINALVDTTPLGIPVVGQEELESSINGDRNAGTVEQRSVNYLVWKAAGYHDLIARLDQPSELNLPEGGRNALHYGRRSILARLRARLFDEIGAAYPWLAEDCERKKSKEGLSGNPGTFSVPFGPFKGVPIKDVHPDYLMSLLGRPEIQKGFRTRIERYISERLTRLEAATAGREAAMA